MPKPKAGISVGMISSPLLRERETVVTTEGIGTAHSVSEGNNSYEADNQHSQTVVIGRLGTAAGPTSASLSTAATATFQKNPTPLSSDHFHFPRSFRSSSFSTMSSKTMSKKPSSTFSMGGASTGTGPSPAPGMPAQSQPTPQSQPPQPMISVDQSLLNKTASSSTGIYQQSVLLRSHLQRIIQFTPFLVYSQSGQRASQNVVRQLWETFALGRPLCVLFNLLDIPQEYKITEYADEYYDITIEGEPTKKERQRAIALFIMAVNKLKQQGLWDKDAPLFSISELIVDEMNTNGFVKVVATLLYLMNKLPSSTWSEDLERPLTASTSSHASRDDMERSNLVRELIETERKYCQDLETMQNYVESLRQSNLVDEDTIHKLFPALGKLTDFQRKLLIGMEATYEHPLDEQNWGQCFVKHEKEFDVYDAYIANYSQALDLALAEQPTLMAASQLINPLQLPAFLIKPIQRLCRYPMLLTSLHKLTPQTSSQYKSLTESCDAVKRIAAAANRAIREKENADTTKDLFSRVKDWKGLNSSGFGSLLLDDVFGVESKGRGYNEYHIFLFGRMLLLCRPKESLLGDGDKDKEERRGVPGFFKSASSNTIAAAATGVSGPSGTSVFLAGGAVASRRAKTPFTIKGSLYIRNIIEITPETTGPYAIHIKYQDRIEPTKWTLQCRNEEQVSLWQGEIKHLMDLWAIEEAEIRKNAKAALLAMKEQRAVDSSRESLTGVNSNKESLDGMRSARRPMHPYLYTFDSNPVNANSAANYAQKTRMRNGSLDYGTDFKSRNDQVTGVGRGRSVSVSSLASDVYDSRMEREPEGGYMSSANNSEVDLHELPNPQNAATTSGNNKSAALVPPQLEWNLPSPTAIPASFEEKAGAVPATQSTSQTYIRPLPIPKPQITPRSASRSSRMVNVPPQAPPPSGPQPPRPNAIPHPLPSPLSPPPAYSRAPHPHPLPPVPAHAATLPPAPIRLLPTIDRCVLPSNDSAHPTHSYDLPQLSRTPTATLRQRVGDRIPAPLAGVASQYQPRGTQFRVAGAPDLPSPEIRDHTPSARPPARTPSSQSQRPLSHRKSSTPLRGPRERGSTTMDKPLNTAYLEVSRDRPSQQRSRSHSHASTLHPQPRVYSRDHHPSVSNIVEKADSESSFTSDYSRPTSSDEHYLQLSPITPPSSASDGRDRLAPNRPKLQTIAQQVDIEIPEALSEDNPTAHPGHNFEKTPQTAYHETSERAMFLSGGKVQARIPSNTSSGCNGVSTKSDRSARSKSHSRTASSASHTEQSGADTSSSMITVRLHSEGSKFLLKMSYSTSRREFVDKIRKKIRICSSAYISIPPERLHTTRFAEEEQVSYLDARGQFVPLRSDNDFSMAWKSVTCARPNPEDRGLLILAVGPINNPGY